MNNDTFIELLEKNASDYDEKVLTLQFFIDNFPVLIDERVIVPPGLQMNTGNKIWTKLSCVDITETTVDRGSPEKLVNYAFNQLVKQVVELKEFLNKLKIN